MKNKSVFLEIRKPGVAILKISRPHVRNAMNWQSIHEFDSSIAALKDDPSVRALIITGAGDSFIAGGDLNDLHKTQTEQDGLRLSSIMTRALNHLEALPYPTIAAINGPARGGGTEIALACDIRIMEEHTDFGFVQVNLGLTPGWGAGQRLLRLVGYSRAFEWLTTGAILSAMDMEKYGLANRVVPPGGSLQEAINISEVITLKPGNAAAAVKSMLRAGIDLPPQSAAAFEGSLFPSLWASDAHIQAVEAFISGKDGD